jgi:hypothetical protein
LLPAMNPKRAEIAVAVENQQRFWRRRGDPDVAFHVGTLNQWWREMQESRLCA